MGTRTLLSNPAQSPMALTGRKENRLTLQARSTNQAEPSEVPPIVHEVLHSSSQPLGLAIRAFMEPRFGHDFSRVRLHTDRRVTETAQVMNGLKVRKI